MISNKQTPMTIHVAFSSLELTKMAVCGGGKSENGDTDTGDNIFDESACSREFAVFPSFVHYLM